MMIFVAWLRCDLFTAHSDGVVSGGSKQVTVGVLFAKLETKKTKGYEKVLPLG